MKLWGLIKQGWKCKDCGINAHRVCKDRVVIECRSKRNYSIPRQSSNSGNESGTIRNRSSSNRSSTRDHPKVKQKATQTETYDDLFMSDDSASSNECINDDNDSSNTLYSSITLVENQNDWSPDDNASPSKPYDNSSHHSNNHGSVTQRTNRHRLHKKSPKRRKSLPSQVSSNDEPHTSVITLIPRGPLICSNSENLESWLPDRLFHKNFNNNNTLNNTLLNSAANTASTTSSITTNNSNINLLDSNASSLASNDNETSDKNTDHDDSSVKSDSECNTSLTTLSSTGNKSVLKDISTVPKLTVTNTIESSTSNLYMSSKTSSTIVDQNYRKSEPSQALVKDDKSNSSSKLISIDDTTINFTKYDRNHYSKVISSNITNYSATKLMYENNVNNKDKPNEDIPNEKITIPTTRPHGIIKPSKLEFDLNQIARTIPSRDRLESDSDFNDLIEDCQSENNGTDSIYSSNEEENDVFIKIKLKEAEKVGDLSFFL